MLLYKIMAVFGFTATKLLYLFFYYFLRGYWSASIILKRETLIEKLNKIICFKALIFPPLAHVNTSLLLHSPFSRFVFNDVVFPYNRGVKPGLSLGRCTWLTLQTVMCSICLWACLIKTFQPSFSSIQLCWLWVLNLWLPDQCPVFVCVHVTVSL